CSCAGVRSMCRSRRHMSRIPAHRRDRAHRRAAVGARCQTRRMQLARVIETSAAVAATRSRTAKTALLAETLREASGQGEARLTEGVADYLAGGLPQRTVGVGYRGLSELPDPAPAASLGVVEVDAALEALRRMAGSGSAAARASAVGTLFARATQAEQRWLV